MAVSILQRKPPSERELALAKERLNHRRTLPLMGHSIADPTTTYDSIFTELNDRRTGKGGIHSLFYHFSRPSKKRQTAIETSVAALENLAGIYFVHGIPEVKNPESGIEKRKAETFEALVELHGAQEAVSRLKERLGPINTLDTLVAALNAGNMAALLDALVLNAELTKESVLEPHERKNALRVRYGLETYRFNAKASDSPYHQLDPLKSAAELLKSLCEDFGTPSTTLLRKRAEVLELLGMKRLEVAESMEGRGQETENCYDRSDSIHYYSSAAEFYLDAARAFKGAKRLYEAVNALGKRDEVFEHEQHATTAAAQCNRKAEELKGLQQSSMKPQNKLN